MMLKLGGFLVVVLLLLAPAESRAELGWLDEVKLGVMAHDVPIGGDHRESGADINGEILFTSPSFLEVVFAPRPHLGVSVNTAGGNSYGYGGLTWTVNFLPFFAGLGLGGAVHTGPDTVSPTTRDHLGLGTRVLFHESVEFGYHITPVNSVSLFLDHISNANTGSHNPGITNLGVRTGFSF